MRAYPPIPTDEPLPLSIFFADPDQVPDGPPLRPQAVARFDALLHELNPDALRVDSVRIRNLCAWVASLPPDTAQDVLDRRLQHLDELRSMLEVHVVGTHNCARAALRHMMPRKRGHIVIVNSHVAHRAFVDCGGYTAAKAGQLGLARVLAEEARPYNIRVTSLLPGATDTPIWDDRPGFDRAKMMSPADVAGFLVAIVARPGIAVEEVTLTPPAGAL